jgi:2-hydroxy-3-oxopropionate reductase
MIMAGQFDPGFRVDLHLKDLQNALDVAHSVHAPVPLTAFAMEVLQGLHVAGEGSADHSAIVRHYERLAGIRVCEAPGG